MASDVVVDTHVLLWMLGDDRKLSARARRAIHEAQRVVVSSISFWEVGMLVAKGRVELDRPLDRWCADVLASGIVTDAPVAARVAVAAASLVDFHGDPADRLIAATATSIGAPLVSKDRLLRNWARTAGAVPCVW